MIEFVLNDQVVHSSLSDGVAMLDYIREHQRLRGTKLGCREGECGACSVLVGELIDDRIRYRSMCSCIMPLGNARHKHIVTVEGLNMETLSPVQQAFVDTSGTQCGFCTVGFVVAMTGAVMRAGQASTTEVIESMDGNVCRCTGYKSIERAAADISKQLVSKPATDELGWLVQSGFLPTYFLGIRERLLQFQQETIRVNPIPADAIFIGGATDLFVQKGNALETTSLIRMLDRKDLRGIHREGDRCYIGSATTMADLYESSMLQEVLPEIRHFGPLFASAPLRNMSTIGGNLVNASPIGDSTALFLALNSELKLVQGTKSRTVLLKDFYQGYKQMDLLPGEYVAELSFLIPGPDTLFSFEKVSKRTYLDIASVNTACWLDINAEDKVQSLHLSAGGLGPIPMYLHQTVAFLTGKAITTSHLTEAISVLNQEVSPISDARGSSAYKRLLIRQLFLAHFMNKFADKVDFETIMAHTPTA